MNQCIRGFLAVVAIATLVGASAVVVAPTPSQASSCYLPVEAAIVYDQVRNVGSGNMAAQTFVGNSGPIGSGQWFSLAATDGSINQNVPGLAVQRLNNSIFVALWGNHKNNNQAEGVAARITLKNATWTGISNLKPYPKGHGLEDQGDGKHSNLNANKLNPFNDEASITSGGSEISLFAVVTTDSDNFAANYQPTAVPCATPTPTATPTPVILVTTTVTASATAEASAQCNDTVAHASATATATATATAATFEEAKAKALTKATGKAEATAHTMAQAKVACAIPTPTPTPTPSPTATPVPTATATPVPTATATPIPTATATPVPTQEQTSEQTTDDGNNQSGQNQNTTTQTSVITGDNNTVTQTNTTNQIITNIINEAARKETVVTSPGLSISIVDDRDVTRPGHTFTYQIRVENTGDVKISDAKIVDRLPGQLEIIGVSDDGDIDGQNVTWSNIVLSPGEHLTVWVKVKVKLNTANGTLLTNRAKVTSDDEGLSASAVEFTVVERLGQVAATVIEATPIQIMNVPITAKTGMGIVGTLFTLFGGSGLAFVTRRNIF